MSVPPEGEVLTLHVVAVPAGSTGFAAAAAGLLAGLAAVTTCMALCGSERMLRLLGAGSVLVGLGILTLARASKPVELAAGALMLIAGLAAVARAAFSFAWLLEGASKCRCRGVRCTLECFRRLGVLQCGESEEAPGGAREASRTE